MPEVNHPPGRIRFGAFEVDLRAGELRKHGLPIRLQAQPFRVLELLLERSGNVVTREELKRKLWPADTFGDFDHGLNKAINKIREALNDSASHPRFVETVARRGYRFIAEVTTTDGPPSSVEPVIAAIPETQDHPRELAEQSATRGKALKPMGWKVAAGLLLLALATLSVWQLLRTHGKSSEIRSLAVLPMENLSNDLSQEYFTDGMTDELITALGTISGLRVISRTSMMPYKHTRKPLREIARELNIDAVVEGTVLRSGEQVRITAQLIRAAADEHVWSRSYQGDVRDTLQLQDQVARDIASHIRIQLTAHEHTLLSDTKVVNPEAYDAYLKGRYFWNKRTEQGLQQAINYFGQAIAKDSNYAQAYSGLADSYALLGDWEYGGLPPQEAFPKAKAVATRALELDDSLGEAHASLALCLKSFDWDWKSADVELRRAIQLSPSYATAHQWYAWNLMILGRNQEGINEMKRAESLDPLSLIIGADIADALLIAHRYNESIQQSRKTIEMDPSFAMAHYQLGQALVQVRQYDEAIRELQEAIDLSRGNPICTSHLAYTYAVSGRRNDAMSILDDLKNGSKQHYANAANIALIYAGLNERDQAFLWLQKAYQQRFNPSILVRPAFDALRSDPRFRDLLRRLGLPIAAHSF
ncbi:MAG: winged helix-turn-helix domain-containing protein [Acidobacteriaceae bacterium]|nr:winged helix-turn-helix domain-containing protein [Acidobacteriaceae bacterium]